MSSSISVNLRRLRKSNNLTQEALARKSGISRNAYRSIETGASEPRSSTLASIAKALNVSVFDITADIPKLNTLRFRTSKSYTRAEKAEREQIKVEVANWLNDFNDLEKVLNETNTYLLENKKIPADSIGAASCIRTELKILDEECINDISGILEKIGIKILMIVSDLKKFFGLSVGPDDGGPAIVVNIEEDIPVERRIFTAVHEFGHLLLHSDSYYSEQEEEDDLQEKEADQFASYFLMPKDQFVEVWEEGRGLHWVDNVLHTKRRFRVSYKTVLRRLIDEDKAEKSIYRYFMKSYKERYGRKLSFKEEPYSYVANKNEPKVLDNIDFIEDRLSRLVRKALEREIISMSRAAEILNINIEEMRQRVEEWKMLR